jgi:transposase InsO family protein
MQRSLKANSITQSMSRKGECHDNAVAENFSTHTYPIFAHLVIF